MNLVQRERKWISQSASTAFWIAVVGTRANRFRPTSTSVGSVLKFVTSVKYA